MPWLTHDERTTCSSLASRLDWAVRKASRGGREVARRRECARNVRGAKRPPYLPAPCYKASRSMGRSFHASSLRLANLRRSHGL
jgi:hypothetical protein